MIPSLLPTYTRVDLAFEHGQGSWLVTDGGERYLDLGAGIAVNALGHAHPALVEVLTEQAQKLWHVSNLYQIPAQQALADALGDRRSDQHLRVTVPVQQQHPAIFHVDHLAFGEGVERGCIALLV